MTTGETVALTIWTFVGKVMSLLSNMLSRLGRAVDFTYSCSNYLLSYCHCVQWLVDGWVNECKKICSQGLEIKAEGLKATPTLPYLAPDHRSGTLDTPDMTSPTPVVPRTRQWDRKLPRGKGVCRLTGSGPRRALPALAPGSRSRRAWGGRDTGRAPLSPSSRGFLVALHLLPLEWSLSHVWLFLTPWTIA